MDLRKVKYKIKNISFIGNIYNILYGNKKWEKQLKMRNQSLNLNGLHVISEIEDLLNQSNASFFVDCGTLLGIIRDGRLLAWDDDIDFGIFINSSFSWEKLEKCLMNIGMVKIHQFKYRNEITEQTYMYNGISIDFFNHVQEGNKTFFYSYRKIKGKKYISECEFSVDKFVTARITGVRSLNLNNININIPENAEEYLACLYGKDWKVPNPDWSSGSGPSCFPLDGERGYME